MILKAVAFNCISIATVSLNFLLQSVMLWVVNKIGLKTISETSMQLCSFVFISQFINTGLIGLISNADFKNTPLNFIPIQRKYPDFNESWFIDFGVSLTNTMMIQSVMPYVQIGIVIVKIRLNKAMLEKNISVHSCEQILKTNAHTIQQFVESYAGPEVELHIRYSFIFNSIFVCFTYGLALPILFPITLFTLINMYISERYLFAYYYRKPPVFGGDMNDGALKILTYAPFCMIAFGYWQLGNRQIFFNDI